MAHRPWPCRRRLRIERTRAVPDVTVSAGIRRFSGDDSTVLVAGVSLPIPVFDQDRGTITAAQGELQAAEARLNAARFDAEADIRTARFQLGAAQSRANAAGEGETSAAEAGQRPARTSTPDARTGAVSWSLRPAAAG